MVKRISDPSLGFFDNRYLQIASNLSDVANAGTSRDNLGVDAVAIKWATLLG